MATINDTYNVGDKLSVSTEIDGEQVTRTVWVNEHETGRKVIWNPFDSTCPIIPLSEFDEPGEAEDFEFALLVAAEDALPTEPGEYEDVARYLVGKVVREYDYNMDEKTKNDMSKPWVLREDGVWVAPDEDAKVLGADEGMRQLAARGFHFVPWSERDNIEDNPELDELLEMLEPYIGELIMTLELSSMLKELVEAAKSGDGPFAGTTAPDLAF